MAGTLWQSLAESFINRVAEFRGCNLIQSSINANSRMPLGNLHYMIVLQDTTTPNHHQNTFKAFNRYIVILPSINTLKACESQNKHCNAPSSLKGSYIVLILKNKQTNKQKSAITGSNKEAHKWQSTYATNYCLVLDIKHWLTNMENNEN